MFIDTLLPSQQRVVLPQISMVKPQNSSNVKSGVAKKASKISLKFNDAVSLDRQLVRSQEINTMCMRIATEPGIFPSTFVKGKRTLQNIEEAYTTYLSKRKIDGLFESLATKTMERIKGEEKFTRDQAAFILGMSATTLGRNYDDYIMRGRHCIYLFSSD